ncbi:MAG: HAMP domain-containing sensor histidine kinase [Candidatus Saccharibacteria bacterium]|nr:HAMP domain-containing sensor histidine kinase [Candidatus Saccharibacteria bacterium]
MSEVNGFAVVAHELKSPISTIRQLALGMDFDDLALCKQNRSKLISVSDHAIRQVNDLLKISRLEDGLFEMEPVSARSICNDVLAELDDLFISANRRISTKFTNRSHLVYANREMLRSIIYNFCVNALNYSESGTISEILVQDTKQRISRNRETDRVRISVRDFGPALPPSIWYKVRHDLYDIPEEIAMRPGNAGLGLYISSQFSRAMNCQISAVRHKDGTTFSITLPVSEQLSLFGD